MRTLAQRVSDVRRLVDAASATYEGRGALRESLVRTTGLSAEGVELGFESLEREASDAELQALVRAAGDSPAVHVILSANVFVAPLRALALARAASARVTVWPSSRDPILAHALVEAAADPAVAVGLERNDWHRLVFGEIHVYGRDASVAAVRAAVRPGVVVRAHGPGFGVAVVTRSAALAAAADAVARDIVAFDQRGCLSPRLAFVTADAAEPFAALLDQRLAVWAKRVPRGALTVDERVASARWCDSVAFAGPLWRGTDQAVALVGADVPLAAVLPPPGRHVVVAPLASIAELRLMLGVLADLVIVVGTDAPNEIAAHRPKGARISALGEMQRPRLDGPVDLRSVGVDRGAAATWPLAPPCRE